MTTGSQGSSNLLDVFQWKGKTPRFDPKTGEPEFESDLAEAMLNKHVFIVISYYAHGDDAHEHLLQQKEFHGPITRINEREGIVVKLQPSGEEYKLPPDFRIFRLAPPGQYHVESTGEVVESPDFLAMFCLQQAPGSG